MSSAEAPIVYDPDGLNPHGRELATLLAREWTHLDLVVATDAEWVPEGLNVRATLPGNRGGASKVVQALRLIRSLAWVAGAALRSRRPCIVVWTRSAVDDLAFALLAFSRVPVAVLVHDPVPREHVGMLRRWTTRLLRSRARWLLAHSVAMADEISDREGRAVQTCAFPPSRGWWTWARRGLAPEDKPSVVERKVHVLILGQLRPDKGIGHLPDILTALRPEDRRRIVLHMCGKGSVDDALLATLNDLVAVADHTRASFIPDIDFGEVIAGCQILLAPYVGATQSASVALALTAGLQVIAYDVGALGDLVDESGLVPPGDASAMALTIRRAFDDTGIGRCRRALTQWEDDFVRDWLSLLRGPVAVPTSPQQLGDGPDPTAGTGLPR